MPKQNSGRLAATANELYWGTTRPAGHLAHELGISRSKFYALIEPLRLQVACATCGAPLTFSSRTDREARRGRCADCGVVAAVEAKETSVPEAGPRRAQPAETAPGVGRRIAAPGERELWMTAIAGVALGALVTAWWRRR